MGKKITWNKVYSDFKTRLPNWHKEVVYWCPHDYLTILIYVKDGRKATYDYLNHKLTFLDEYWIHDLKQQNTN